MKFVSVVCVVLGMILLIMGVGMRLMVESNEEVQELSKQIEIHMGERVRPALAGRLLRGEYEAEGHRISLDELLAEEAEDYATFAKVLVILYANANLLAIAGAALLIAAILAKRQTAG